MSKSTSEPTPVKRCSQGDNCIHPQGPVLPRTSEYFYMNGKHASARCRECQKAYRAEHHQEHKDYDNERSRKYAKTHKGQYDHYQEHYHARKKDNGGSYTFQELNTQYKQQKGCCWWCGQFVGLDFDLDHRIPVSKGGTSDISNIVISCRPCNDSKKDKLPHEWKDRLI